MTLSLASLRAVNVARCVEGFNQPLHLWSLYDWMVATGGEVGEALNIIKKLNRERDGVLGNTRSAAELLADLADELADGVIYVDLVLASERLYFHRDSLAALLAHDEDGPADWSDLPLSELGAAALWAAGRLARRCHEITRDRQRAPTGLGSDGEMLRYPAVVLVASLARVAARAGIDLDAAIVSKFNRTSEARGVSHRLELA